MFIIAYNLLKGSLIVSFLKKIQNSFKPAETTGHLILIFLTEKFLEIGQ